MILKLYNMIQIYLERISIHIRQIRYNTYNYEFKEHNLVYGSNLYKGKIFVKNQIF